MFLELGFCRCRNFSQGVIGASVLFPGGPTREVLTPRRIFLFAPIFVLSAFFARTASIAVDIAKLSPPAAFLSASSFALLASCSVLAVFARRFCAEFID